MTQDRQNVQEQSSGGVSQPPLLSRSPEFCSVYANNAALGMTVFELALTFGEVTGVTQDGRQMIEQKVKLSISPIFAKILMAFIAQSIGAYERQFGEIKVPIDGLVIQSALQNAR